MSDEILFQGQGLFVPTVEVFDVSELMGANINDELWKEYLVRMRQVVNNIALALNMKETALYDRAQFLPSASWFPRDTLSSATDPSPTSLYRQAFRMVVNFGALPNTTTKSVAHGIEEVSEKFSVVRLYGASTAGTNPGTMSFIPLPYASPTLTDCIELYADATQVTVRTGADWSAYHTTYIVIEVLKE